MSVVSLWIGAASSKTSFDAFVKTSYSEDGDFLGSEFSRAFAIGFYDEGWVEAEYREAGTCQVGELLKGASYDDVIVYRLGALEPLDREANCAILLYDYRHEGRTEWAGSELWLRFIGTVAYR